MGSGEPRSHLTRSGHLRPALCPHAAASRVLCLGGSFPAGINQQLVAPAWLSQATAAPRARLAAVNSETAPREDSSGPEAHPEGLFPEHWSLEPKSQW